MVDLENLEAGESGQISKTEVATNEWVRLKHAGPCTEVTAAMSVGTIESVSYAYFTDVKVTAVDAAAEVTLTGKKLENKQEVTAVRVINVSGEDCEIANPLIDKASLPRII